MATTSSTSTSVPKSASEAHRYIEGHCGCGSLRYRINVSTIDRDLTLAAFCHCSQCQRMNGAPFVWTSHWLYPAVTWDPPAEGPPPGAPDAPPSGESSTGHFSPNMQTYEQMKGRKWKLRCRSCGSPMGSWNAFRGKWTIWPVTMKRKAADGIDGARAQGDFDVPNDILELVKGRHHQFYGSWRAVDMHDGLRKFTGYKDESEEVDAVGKPFHSTR